VNTLLAVNELSHAYGNFPVLDTLSFELKAGEILGFLGLNGAGKSTTLQMLSGVLHPQQGQITVCGHDLHRAPLQAKQHLGYLPEQPPLYQQMRVTEYLLFCARLHKLSAKAARKACDKVLSCCQLEQVKTRFIKHLSQGYQQRVGIAQALIHEPDVLLLDEPTANLDPQQRQEIWKLLTNLSAQQQAVIFSTHILSEVTQLCSHVQIIHEGRLVLDKTPITHLNDQSEAQHLSLQFNHAPDQLSTIADLKGVTKLKQINPQHWLVSCELNSQLTDLQEKLITISVQADWGLYQIQALSNDDQHIDGSPDLASLFFKLTQSS